jgi:hypothetical protein
MKDKTIKFIKYDLPCIFAALIIPIGIYNGVVGIYSNNVWQSSTGLFQLLFAAEVFRTKP